MPPGGLATDPVEHAVSARTTTAARHSPAGEVRRAHVRARRRVACAVMAHSIPGRIRARFRDNARVRPWRRTLLASAAEPVAVRPADPGETPSS
jgi:hypothetical protein